MFLYFYYLGLFLDEHLDYKITADHVAKSAQRALGLIIAKSKAFGGIPFNCFKKMYESIVVPIVNYGSCVWGQQQFSSINSVHNRACRYFLGVKNVHQMLLFRVILVWILLLLNNMKVLYASGLEWIIWIIQGWIRRFLYGLWNIQNMVYKITLFYKRSTLDELLNCHLLDKKHAVSLVRQKNMLYH